MTTTKNNEFKDKKYCSICKEELSKFEYGKCPDCVQDLKMLNLYRDKIKQKRDKNRYNMKLVLPCEGRQ